jgi:integrase
MRLPVRRGGGPAGRCLRLLATTGMRRGEVLGLRWTDVDLEAGTLAVRSTRVRAGNRVVKNPAQDEGWPARAAPGPGHGGVD